MSFIHGAREKQRAELHEPPPALRGQVSLGVTSKARNVEASLVWYMGRQAHVSDKGYPVLSLGHAT